METGFEKPTGMRVRGAAGEIGTFTFPEFVAAIERGVVRAEDEVFSHIVTEGKWVPVGGLKVYQMVRPAPIPEPPSAADPAPMQAGPSWEPPAEAVWPPPPDWRAGG